MWNRTSSAGTRNAKRGQQKEQQEQLCTVKHLLGVTELDLVKFPRERRIDLFLDEMSTGEQQQQVLVHCKTGKATPFGSLHVLKLSELRDRVEAMTATSASTTRRKPPTLQTASRIDIGNLQATLTTSDAAMVQVASNFNILENGSISRGPDCGFLVDIASQDTTQGPAAVFGTLSAYLYRAHFAPAVNLLQQVPDYFGVPRNGKLLLSGNEKVLHKENFDEVASEICVGLHTDCPILFGRDDHRQIFSMADRRNNKAHDNNVEDNESLVMYPTVDHVLSASVNYNRIGQLSQACLDSVHGQPKAYCDQMARVLLRAAYEGTYLAAILKGRKTLLLTLIGGGSFGNPVPIIVEELTAAHERWAGHPASRLESVTICLYSERDEAEVKRYL